MSLAHIKENPNHWDSSDNLIAPQMHCNVLEEQEDDGIQRENDYFQVEKCLMEPMLDIINAENDNQQTCLIYMNNVTKQGQ